MPTFVVVRKWGRKLAVVIPTRFAKDRGIQVGTVIDLEDTQVSVPQRRRYRLAELMEGFRPEHRRGEWDVGGRVGKETW